VTGNLAVVVASVIMSLGGGGSLLASHASLSAKLDSKLDQILAAQGKLENEIAEIKGARVDQTVREHDGRIRSLEESVAALKAEVGGRR
jgi:hypothetical protein